MCGTQEEIPDFIEQVFPESDVICPKCNKAMKGNKPMENATETKVEHKEESSKHPEDPRPDLKVDAGLWLELLKRLYVCNKELYFTFHGLRIAGSKLELKNNNIEFTFSDEFDDAFIEKAREKYIKPHAKLIELVMARLAKDVSASNSFNSCPV